MIRREADELVGEALALAADGEIERATRVAQKVERLAPWSPRYLQLQVYLDEEQARRAADRLVATARAQQAEGRLGEARRAAEEALAAMPWHAAAGLVLEELGEAEGEEAGEPTASEPEVRSPAAAGDGPDIRAAPAEPSGPDPAPETAGPEPDPDPDPAGARAEALTAEALRHFTADEHQQARAAVGRALELDPSNRRARELQRILRVLG